MGTRGMAGVGMLMLAAVEMPACGEDAVVSAGGWGGEPVPAASVPVASGGAGVDSGTCVFEVVEAIRTTVLAVEPCFLGEVGVVSSKWQVWSQAALEPESREAIKVALDALPPPDCLPYPERLRIAAYVSDEDALHRAVDRCIGGCKTEPVTFYVGRDGFIESFELESREATALETDCLSDEIAETVTQCAAGALVVPAFCGT